VDEGFEMAFLGTCEVDVRGLLLQM
jgi:hypothetical protein